MGRKYPKISAGEWDAKIGALSFNFSRKTLCPECTFQRTAKSAIQQGRLAGLKEAAEIIERHYDHREGIRLSRKAIRARISSLSPKEEGK